MSERYSKLFALSENLYATGSPVVIAAGALLKDNQTGKVITQLKLRNISSKRIKAATVCVQPLDTVGNPLGDAVHYQYLDLNVAWNEEFGQKSAIALPNSSTRSFVVDVEEVVFATNTLWNGTDVLWKPLGNPKPLRDIGDAELVKQFRLKYGMDCKYLPTSEKDLWYCACGVLNREEDGECISCRKSFSLMRSYDLDELNVEKNNRLAEEKAKAEQAAEDARVQAEKNKKKAKKFAKIIVPIAVIVVIAIVAISAYTSTQAPKKYASAVTMMAEGKYDEAAVIFTELDDYEDSAYYLSKIYDEATAMLTEGQYEQACTIFAALGEYKDSASMKEKAELAVWVMSHEKYMVITDFADSSDEFFVHYDALNQQLVLENRSEMELEPNTNLIRAGTESTLKGIAFQSYQSVKSAFEPLEENGVTCIVTYIMIAGGETYVGSTAAE